MTVTLGGVPIGRDWFARDSVELAPLLLGALLTHRSDIGSVAVRLTEVEAYRGNGEDPGSHAFRGPTPRTTVMFGEPAHLYVYFTYGMHTMVNIVCERAGQAAAVLLRAGDVVAGHELATARRAGAPARELARGPARLTQALGIALSDTGVDLVPSSRFALDVPVDPLAYRRTARTGVSGPGGADRFDWRFAAVDEFGRELPSVLPHKRHPKSL